MAADLLHREEDDEDSWEVRAFEEDTNMLGCTWPPRSYTCAFCRREFRSAQALGGHMNVHRRDRARLHELLPLNKAAGEFLRIPHYHHHHHHHLPPANPFLPNHHHHPHLGFLQIPQHPSIFIPAAPHVGFASFPPIPRHRKDPEMEIGNGDAVSGALDSLEEKEVDLELRLGQRLL